MKREKIKKKREKRVALLFALCYLLFIMACQSGSDGDSDISDGMGRVSLRLSDTVGRTILPSAPADLNYFSRFQVKFHDTDTDEPVTGSPSTVGWDTSPATEAITVPPGNYIITVDAFTTVNSVSTLAARGVAGTELSPITISANQTNTVPVTLKMLLGEENTTGTFTWDITLPAITAPNTLSKANMLIRDMATQDPIGETVNLLNTASGTRSGLPSTVYNVEFELVESEIIYDIDGDPTTIERNVVIWKEILHIYSTLTTNFPFAFTNDHFSARRYIVTFDYDYGGFTAEQSVLHNGLIGTLPPSNGRNGYWLEGWYDDKDGAGKKYASTDRILSDITLYANWIEDTTVVINVSVDPIEDVTINLVDDNDDPITLPITLSRSATGADPDMLEIILENASDFSYVYWEITGIGTDVDGSGNSFTLDANDASYNSLGGHSLRLTVFKGTGADAVQYQKNIPFIIVP